MQFLFDKNNLKPLIIIFNLLCDTCNSKIDLSEELKIYNKELNISILEKEMETYYSFKFVKDVKTFEGVINLFKKKEIRTTFLNLYILLKIYLTTPVTSVTAERSFSCLKRVKTYMRTTMIIIWTFSKNALKSEKSISYFFNAVKSILNIFLKLY
jgi:hypothetical protein